MSRDTDNSFFISSPLVNKYAGLYQQLLGGIVSYRELGNRIIKRIKVAHAFRQIEQVRELSRLLLNIPIREYQLIGQYYLYWCGYRNQECDIASLETIIDHTRIYKAQALLSRGAIEYDNRRNQEALYFFTEALKARPNVSEYIAISTAIAVAKAVDGFHNLALSDLEKLLPIIKHAEPRLYFDYLNSYAVELGEAGRAQEARNVSRLVLASPFIRAYPEWQETAQDLREPNHSFVTVPSIEYEPVEIEARPKVVPIQPQQPIEPEEPAKVISFPAPELREAPRPNQPKRVKRDELSDMTPAQKRELLLLGIKSGRLVEGEYNKLLFISGMVESGPLEQVIDLEDKKLLNELITRWANLIEPEELAAVMSALRDCEDDLRRADIIDNIIRKAFEYSATCNLTEAEWRTKVECRLPEK
jgi:tetratricopeptide (TPR) repeat protein